MKLRSLLPLLVASLAAAVNAQTPAAAPKPAPLGSMVLDWTKLPVVPTKTGERRSLFDGPTPTFVNAEGHITTLNPGEAPHEPHRHPDEELRSVVKEGLIEVTINGHAQRAGAGSVFFFASEDLHGMRNVGTTPRDLFRLPLHHARPPPGHEAALILRAAPGEDRSPNFAWRRSSKSGREWRLSTSRQGPR